MGNIWVKSTSTPFTWKSRLNHAGRCGRGVSGASVHYDPQCFLLGFGVDGEDLGRKLHLPHLPGNHDQNLRVDVEGVFRGHPFITTHNILFWDLG